VRPNLFLADRAQIYVVSWTDTNLSSAEKEAIKLGVNDNPYSAIVGIIFPN